MNEKIKKISFLYLGFNLFFNLLLWIPIFYEFQKQSGLTEKQIFNIQSLYYIAFIVFEMPTGYLADKIGKKVSLILGATFLALANFIPVIEQTYLAFLVHFIFIAASRSLISGSASALLYDVLKDEGHGDKYKEIEGKARSVSLIARLLLWPLAGILMKYSITAPYLITTVFCVIAVLFSFALPSESKNQNSQNDQNSFIKDLQKVSQIMKQTPTLLLLMIQGSGFFVLERICMLQLFQPLLKNQNFSVESFGFVMSGMTIFEAFAAAKSSKLKKYFNSDKSSIFWLTIFLCGTFSVLGILPHYFVLLGLGFFALFCGFIFPIQKQLLNDHIPAPEYRATLLSVESIVQRIMASIFTYLTGIFISTGKLSWLFFGTSCIIILITILVSSMLKKRQDVILDGAPS